MISFPAHLANPILVTLQLLESKQNLEIWKDLIRWLMMFKKAVQVIQLVILWVAIFPITVCMEFSFWLSHPYHLTMPMVDLIKRESSKLGLGGGGFEYQSHATFGLSQCKLEEKLEIKLNLERSSAKHHSHKSSLGSGPAFLDVLALFKQCICHHAVREVLASPPYLLPCLPTRGEVNNLLKHAWITLIGA